MTVSNPPGKAMLTVIKPLYFVSYLLSMVIISRSCTYKDGDKFLTLSFKGENFGQALLCSSLYAFHPIKSHRQSVVVAIVITVL